MVLRRIATAAALLLALTCLALSAAPTAFASLTPRSSATGASATGASATAALDDETRLAQKFAPVVRLVEQREPCGSGEPYEPTDVDALLGNDTVALRGPWTSDDLIGVAPKATQLARGLRDYHLDFPGDPLRPGCDYETWARAETAGHRPTVYAHVLTDSARPGRLALQYWFFYPFNDWNNTHEGDWELIQLEFDAPDATAALTRDPVRIGYSQHEGVEQATWPDDKLDVVDGTHPVVHPAAGSHANFYDSALFLGRSAQQGFGCDDTRGPLREVRPVVKVLPQDRKAALSAYPWLGFEGRWGEREQGFFNGPTGPSMKDRWTHPILWAERNGTERAYAVPAGGLLGTRVTGLFCSGVATGSDLLRRATHDPATVLVPLVVLVAFVTWQAHRTTWQPSTPLRLARRRSWGQTLAAAVRMYASRPALFTGIGLITVPIALLISGLERALIDGPDVGGLGNDAGDSGLRVTLAGVVASLVLGFAVVLVQAATTRAAVEIDRGHEIGLRSAYRLALARWRPLLVTFLVWAAAVGLLAASVLLAVIAVVLVVCWALFVPVLIVEECGPLEALRRSLQLVRERALRVVSLIAATVLLAAGIGPLLGLGLLLLVPSLPFDVLNVVSGVTYAVLSPVVALTAAYVYFDARVHEAREQLEDPEVLPSELSP